MSMFFDGRLAPLTNTIGFLECDCSTAVDSYLKWQQPIHAPRGVSIIRHDVAGTLEEVLLRLLPLTSVERRRFLFMPTNSKWTAFFDNGHLSTEASTPMSVLAEAIGCRGLRVCYIADGLQNFPARILELYGPKPTAFLNYIRSISVTYDGSTWSFDANGELQPFEQLMSYTEDREQDRFTYSLLDRYLGQLGIRAFEEGFYLPQSAVLLQKEGPVIPRSKEFGLDNDPPLVS